jgi:hypothetical protein
MSRIVSKGKTGRDRTGRDGTTQEGGRWLGKAGVISQIIASQLSSFRGATIDKTTARFNETLLVGQD